MGSRGGRTYSAPPSTNTAPSMASPMDRTMTARPSPAAPGYAGAAAPAMGARSSFGSGLMGGLLGVGIGSMLFGGGMFGGGGGLGGMGIISLLLQAALLFFVGRWLFRKFMQSRQPAMAGGPNLFARNANTQPGMMPGGARPAAPAVQIGKADYEAFDRHAA